MSFLLDTDICSAYLRRPARLSHRFLQHLSRLAISTVTLAELLTWAHRRSDPDKLLKAIHQDLLSDVQVFPVDQQVAEEFGKVRASLLDSGVVVNPLDLLIAATALCHDLTLVTHNRKHFEVIPQLRIDDWLNE